MVRRNFSIKKSWKIGVSEYRKLISDSRSVLMLVILIVGYQFITMPLLENAELMKIPINCLEPYIAVMNSNFMILLIPIIFLVLMSDFPRIDGNTIFVLQRVGRDNWLLGQLIYFFLAIVSYLYIILCGMCIPVLGRSVLSQTWSDVVLDFSRKFPELAQNSGSVSIPPEIYYHMSPLYAVLMGSVLLLLYLFLLMLLLLVVSVVGKKKIGILLDLVIIAMGMGLCATSSEYRFVLPMAHSLLGVHYTRYFRESVCSVTQSLTYFGVVIAGLLIIAVVLNSKRNFLNENEVD